ncbi:MAG: AraC family transcriptional regulator [Bauldia sp.]|uniref:AraC family transcriptional regulator n=1 Tax=Bauldia sp. TaxID=2575872 RepID=UPI001DC7D5F0|nr:AraC family transcriptional regulator [Bauldia sp.]MCB1495545.1 AraC family transcriptional regulator [Bauldia sp.]
MKLHNELKSLIIRHCVDRRTITAIPRVVLINAPTTTKPGPALYEPVFLLAVQGRKRLMVGDRVLEYGPGTCLMVSVDLPVTAQICEASAEAPYLAVGLRLDRAAIAAMLMEMPEPAGTGLAAIGVGPVTGALLEPMVRLIRLLDQPADIPMLAPLAERELLYRLLQGPQGPVLRQIALRDSHLSRISRAIDWIRRHYDKSCRVEELAEIAGMSPSSFHRHFKAATAMSPLRYQKQVRLQAARDLLLARSVSAGGAAFAVGYESPSQFSREYARQFGMPPARDAARLRGMPVGEAETDEAVVS